MLFPKSADNSRLGSCTLVAPCTVTDPRDNVADRDDGVISTLALPSLENASSLNDNTPKDTKFSYYPL